MEALKIGYRKIPLFIRTGPTTKICIPLQKLSSPSPKCHYSTSTSANHQYERTDNDSINRRLRTLESEIENNPSLAILRSPLRRCKLSQKILPRDLLLQFKSVYLPPPSAPPNVTESDSAVDKETKKRKLKTIDEMQIDLPSISKTTSIKPALKEVILPGNLLRAAEKPGKSLYITLNRAILNEVMSTGKVEQLKRISNTTMVPSRLVEIVDSQIRERVMQEAKVIMDHSEQDFESNRDAEAEAESSFLCLSSEVYESFTAKGVPRRLLYHLQHLFPDESQRHELVSMLRQTPQVARCTERSSSSMQLDGIVGIPYLAPFGPINVALWRARCFFGHPQASHEEDVEDRDTL